MGPGCARTVCRYVKGCTAADFLILCGQPFGITDHQARQFQIGAFSGNAVPGDLAVAQHGCAVTQRTHLAQSVTDKQNAAAFSSQMPQGHEQLLGFLGRQHRRGFVEDQQADVLHQAANDFDFLPLANRQAMDQPLGLHRHAVALRDLANARFELFGRACRGAHRQRDVLRDAEGFEQRKCWNTMPMPRLLACAGLRMVCAWPCQMIVPASGCVTP